jgi:hypothetical protein
MVIQAVSLNPESLSHGKRHLRICTCAPNPHSEHSFLGLVAYTNYTLTVNLPEVEDVDNEMKLIIDWQHSQSRRYTYRTAMHDKWLISL